MQRFTARICGAKNFILGMAVMALVFMLILTVSAQSRTEQATLNFNNIIIMLDGEELIPRDVNGNAVEPFIINGTTYLPVRGIANALGLDVDWDDDANTVILTTPAAQPVNESANIQVAWATEELLDIYEYFHEYFHAEYGANMIIRTDVAITDFDFIWVGNSFDVIEWEVDEDTPLHFFVEEVIHSVGDLTPEKPFKVHTSGHWGVMPRVGISFTDADNNRRYFHISESMKDGSLNIVEFENMYQYASSDD